MSKEEQEIENFGSNYHQSPEDAQLEQINNAKRWLARPFNKGERSTMKCFVERERQTFSMQTVYRCYLEGGEGQQPRFMMSAKKIVGKKTSYYLLSLDENPSDDRGSETVIGKVRGNAVGSRYIVTDHGLAPDKTAAPSMLRKELGIITFQFDSGGPSKIEAWVPAVSSSGAPTVWQPSTDDNGMEHAIETNHFDHIFRLINKQPKWDEVHGGHVLNFQGRVTESSVKNFQLCCLDIEDTEDVILQFGRVGKHRFTMDLKFPLSPIQAFGFCVTCLDGKIADRKGYEYLRRFSTNSTTTNGNTNGSSGTENNASNGKGGGGGNEQYHDDMADAKVIPQSDGNMRGSSSLTGMIREAIPSTQYLKDKWNRTFK
jgi:hypothetical protein